MIHDVRFFGEMANLGVVVVRTSNPGANQQLGLAARSLLFTSSTTCATPL